MKKISLIILCLLFNSIITINASTAPAERSEATSANPCSPGDTHDAVRNMCIQDRLADPCRPGYYFRNTVRDCAKCAGNTTYNEQLKKCE